MLTAIAKRLRATVITLRTVRGADESASENEENLALEALTIRSGLVGGVLAIQGRIAAKGGGDLVLGVMGDLILEANGALDLEQSLEDTIAEVGVTEAFQGVGQDHPANPDPEKSGEPGIVILMSPSKNEIMRCWITSRSKTQCYPAHLPQPQSKKRTTYL